MATREIRTSSQDTICDVCGRTLLRGERADVYLNGGTRRSVCELCKDRALHEGWVREGTVAAYEDSDSPSDRRRSLLGRLRGRREAGAPSTSAPTLRDELDGRSWSETAGSSYSESAPAREPRHVRAVPTSSEQKAATAVELFNGSEHRRTVAGVARSLGEPGVSVAPSAGRASLVNVVVSWELCWYRYEVELSDDQPSVRKAGQGYELTELTPEELHVNAVADEHGSLILR
ncbi:MAG: hypothetical protein QOD66_1774 [Solirubrobacteraceae bacterium]|jgi:hypothetical protein|nr:hypothetical protein [Solirubrobacteraceae bacterium]